MVSPITPQTISRLPHSCFVYVQQVFQCKERLPLNPNALWKIETGVVRSLTWDEEGRTITLGFWSTGDVVGQPLSRLNPYEVECLTPVTIKEIPSNSDDLLPALLAHAWKSETLLSIVHQPSVGDRLLRLLEWLACQFGRPISQGILLNLHLTHQDLAETLGTTRVTITRLLSQLERAGKIVRLPKRSRRLRPTEGSLTRHSLILKQE
jgi:CRP-like cAMP-binding protein